MQSTPAPLEPTRRSALQRVALALGAAAGAPVFEAAAQASSPLTFQNVGDAMYSASGQLASSTRSMQLGIMFPGPNGLKYRSNFVRFDVFTTSRVVLIQYATQFPVEAFLIPTGGGRTTLQMVQNGTATIRYSQDVIWSATSNSVVRYLTLPVGSYYLALRDLSSRPLNECSMVVRPGAMPFYAYADNRWANVSSNTVVLGVPDNATQVSSAINLSYVTGQTERYFLRGCISNSRGGQTVELLSQANYTLYAAGRPYVRTGAITVLTPSGELAGLGNFYVLLRNNALTGAGVVDDPCSAVVTLEKWRRT